jgi:hypothetical protein
MAENDPQNILLQGAQGPAQAAGWWRKKNAGASGNHAPGGGL